MKAEQEGEDRKFHFWRREEKEGRCEPARTIKRSSQQGYRARNICHHFIQKWVDYAVWTNFRLRFNKSESVMCRRQGAM
jgi:hypothetical protein